MCKSVQLQIKTEPSFVFNVKQQNEQSKQLGTLCNCFIVYTSLYLNISYNSSFLRPDLIYTIS